MNPQLAAAHACLNMAEQVLIGRNLECHRRVRPGKGKSTVRFDTGKVRNRPNFCRDVTVPSDADVAASERESSKDQ